MKRIGYLLHHFPRVADTFINSATWSLKKLGTDVHVLPVWRQPAAETSGDMNSQWRAPLSIAMCVLTSASRSPTRFVRAYRLAVKTRRPALRRRIHQLIYFIEAVLGADRLRGTKIQHVRNRIGDNCGRVTMFATRVARTVYSHTFHYWRPFFEANYSRINEKIPGSFLLTLSIILLVVN